MSTVGFPLKMENGIQMLGCPDIFNFFSRSFLEYFCSLLVGNGNLVIFLVMYLNSSLDFFLYLFILKAPSEHFYHY